jgi:hypothetical protein
VAEPPKALPVVVDQYTRAVNLWTTSLGGWAEGEARLASSTGYSLADLLTTPVRLARVVVDAGVRSMLLVPDGLAVLTEDGAAPDGKAGGYGVTGAAAAGPVRTHPVQVPLAPGARLTLRPTDLVGEVHRVVIRAADVHLDPGGVLVGTPPGAVDLTVRIAVAGLPNDTYVGQLVPDGGGTPVPLWIAIDELGKPAP